MQFQYSALILWLIDWQTNEFMLMKTDRKNYTSPLVSLFHGLQVTDGFAPRNNLLILVISNYSSLLIYLSVFDRATYPSHLFLLAYMNFPSGNDYAECNLC